DRAQRELAYTRGKQLQRKRDLIEDDRWKRNHQHQNVTRKREDTKSLPAKQEQHTAHPRADDGKAREEQFRSKDARQQHHQASDDYDKTGRRWLMGGRQEASATFPHEIGSERDNEKTV